MTSLSVVTQMKDFPILIIIGVALIVGILGIIIKYANKNTIAPRSNSSENCGFALQSRVQHPHTHSQQNNRQATDKKQHHSVATECSTVSWVNPQQQEEGSADIKLNPSLNEVKRNWLD